MVANDTRVKPRHDEVLALAGDASVPDRGSTVRKLGKKLQALHRWLRAGLVDEYIVLLGGEWRITNNGHHHVNKKQITISGQQRGLHVHFGIGAQLEVGRGRRLGKTEGHPDLSVVARRAESWDPATLDSGRRLLLRASSPTSHRG